LQSVGYTSISRSVLPYDQIDDHLETTMPWPVYEAKARFSELVDAAVNEGPQVVSRRGVETVAVVSIRELKRWQSSDRSSLIDPLTDPNAPHDFVIPPTRNFTLRPAQLKD
jgi:antitoxin Phd